MKSGGSASLGSLALVAGLSVVASAVAFSGAGGDDYKFLDPLIDVKEMLSQRYVDVPDDQALQTGAINGMIEVLNDPYTVYVPPADRTEFTKELTGEYVGIGASVQSIDGWLTIVSPLEDSPAYRAGLMADDRVVEIDGKSTHKIEIEDCIKLLTGTPGTSVKLTIERKGERIEIPIVRDNIKTKSVKGFHREEADANRWMFLIDPVRRIGYVRLTQFTPACADEMAKALESAGASEGKLAGLVLDLRGNPGGLLNEATRIADMFLREGVIVSTKGRAHPEEITRAEAPGTLPDFPIAVLVNGQSASASEVLSGALVENNRAIVVGTRSFGKGLVQGVLPLPSGNGGELKITEQKYYLPSGRCIQRTDDSADWGVDPSPGFYVPMTDEETLEMLLARRDQDIMRQNGAPHDAAASWSDPDWILSKLKDKQLAAAVKAVQQKVDGGDWKPTGLAAAEKGAVLGGELQKLRVARERLARELIRLDRRAEVLELGGATKGDDSEDFWSDSLDLTGGALKVFDKDGNLVTTLSITGRNLERWLLDADVKKPEPAAEGAGRDKGGS